VGKVHKGQFVDEKLKVFQRCLIYAQYLGQRTFPRPFVFWAHGSLPIPSVRSLEHMTLTAAPDLKQQLESRISQRTGRRIRNLTVELRPERVVLRGLATNYYLKQLAQHGVRELLPHVSLENVIIVDGPHDSPARTGSH
jgi:hypothetical protein